MVARTRRALIGGAAAAALLPLAAACRMGDTATASPTPAAKGTATMDQDGLRLLARLDPAPDAERLGLTYRIENHGPGPAFIYDKIIIHDPERGERARADRAYVYPLPEAGEVLVMKDMAPVPDGMAPTNLTVPLMLRLGPGEALEGRLSFTLPLRPWREYLANDLNFPRQATVDSLRLRIGYALPPEGAEESTFDYAGETAWNFRNPPGTRHRAAALELRLNTPGLPIYLPE